ncbi:MAG: hypothetical protein AB7E55_33255 [Pigmentiphaga sp.]
MSTHTVIRFPTAAKLGEPMATRLPWYQRVLRKLFGQPSGVNLAKRRMDKTRREVFESKRAAQ